MSRFYDKAVWKKARQQQLTAHPLCKHCLETGRYTAATEVDHIIPMSDGGEPLDPSNFRSLCKRCHSSVTLHAKHGTEAKIKGCGADGMPHDPNHPWYIRATDSS